MSYPKYNYLCMIYNRYNPCHVVYVLYNCNISFEGLSYLIYILIITRWYLCRLCYLCRKMSLRLPVVCEYIPRIYHCYTLRIPFIFDFSWSVGFPGWTGAVRLDLELLKPCLRSHQRGSNAQRPSGIFTQSITYIYQGYPNQVMTWYPWYPWLKLVSQDVVFTIPSYHLQVALSQIRNNT